VSHARRAGGLPLAYTPAENTVWLAASDQTPCSAGSTSVGSVLTPSQMSTWPLLAPDTKVPSGRNAMLNQYISARSKVNSLAQDAQSYSQMLFFKCF